MDRRTFIKGTLAAAAANLALARPPLGDAAEELGTQLYSDWDAVVPKFWDVRVFSDLKRGVFGLRADKECPYEWRISLSDARSALRRPGALVTARLTKVPVLTRTDTKVRKGLVKVGVLPEGAFSTPGYGPRFAVIDVPPPNSIELPGTEYIHRKWLPLEAVQKIVAG